MTRRSKKPCPKTKDLFEAEAASNNGQSPARAGPKKYASATEEPKPHKSDNVHPFDHGQESFFAAYLNFLRELPLAIWWAFAVTWLVAIALLGAKLDMVSIEKINLIIFEMPIADPFHVIAYIALGIIAFVIVAMPMTCWFALLMNGNRFKNVALTLLAMLLWGSVPLYTVYLCGPNIRSALGYVVIDDFETETNS